jgi:hypothetical protein
MEGNEDFKVLDDFDMEAFLAQNQNATTEKTEEKQESTPAAETTEATTEAVTTEQVQDEEEGESGTKFLQFLTGETQATTSEEETKKAEVPQEILSELESYKEKLSKYERNQFLKAVVEMGLNPDDAKAIAKEILGTDVSNMSVNDLLAMDTKSETGLDGDDLQDAIDAEISYYESLTPRQKAQFEKELRGKYNQTSESKLLKSILESTPKEQQKMSQEQIDAMLAEDRRQLNEVVKQFVGQDLMGFKVDESVAKQIIDSYDNYPFKHFNDDGTFNAKDYATDVFIKANFNKIVNSAVEYGKQVALKQRTNPDKNGVAGGAGTPSTDNRKPIEKLAEAIDKDEVKVYGNDELPEDVRRVLEQHLKNK